MRKLDKTVPESFTDEMHHELLHLKEIVNRGLGGPDFPWQRYKFLLDCERAHVGRKRVRAAFEVLSGLVGAKPPKKSMALVTPATSDAIGPLASKKPSVSSKIPLPAPTLESICVGADNKRKAEIARIIDNIWEYARSTTRDVADYPAICVAVYKLAMMLGKVAGKNDVKASDWRRTLEARYEVTISVGIAKYNIEAPKSNVFINAIKYVYSFISNNYPNWVKGKDLPSIYR